MYTVGFNFCDSYRSYATQPQALVKVTCGQIKCVLHLSKPAKVINYSKHFPEKQNYLNLYHRQTT